MYHLYNIIKIILIYNLEDSKNFINFTLLTFYSLFFYLFKEFLCDKIFYLCVNVIFSFLEKRLM